MTINRLRGFQTLASVALGCLLGVPASAGVIDWNFGAIGISGASEFTADALKATEVSHIVFTSATTFEEHGFAKVTGILNGATVSTPTGLGTDYTLYFAFNATGDLITSHFSTFDFTLYAVDGVSTFGINGSNAAYVDNGSNTAVTVATNALIDGSIAGAPGTDLSAESLSTFSSTMSGAAAFLSPELPATFHGAFFHSASEPGGITFPGDGTVVIQGGDDTLTFTPEPGSVALLLGGLPALVLFARRRAVS